MLYEDPSSFTAAILCEGFLFFFYDVCTQATVCVIYYTATKHCPPPPSCTKRNRVMEWEAGRQTGQAVGSEHQQNDSLRPDTRAWRGIAVVAVFIIVLSIFIDQHMTYRKH